MYAIIRTGGKQYRVQPGDVIRVEKLDQPLGSEFNSTEVLMIGGDSPSVGAPLVKDASVTFIVTKQTKDKKVIIFKKKRRQGYRRYATHRQPFTELFVKSIAFGGNTAKTDDAPNVIDVDQSRLERIQDKIEAKEARLANRGKSDGETTESAPKKSAANKKLAKKASPVKKKAAKKAAGKKKTAAKKTAKKKTTKK
jgi:large subunit ribosomal protein L21